MSYWDSRRVLVTGGASFIGSHLVERLVHLGARVRVADGLSSGKAENLAGVKQEIEFCQGDLKERAFADEMLKDRDVVFHLAACHGAAATSTVIPSSARQI